MTGAKSMRYLEVGATVYYKREKAKVIEKYKEKKKDYIVLETIEGRRSVPAAKIIWNGNAHLVTPDGYQVAQAIYAVDYAIDSIREQLNKWDQDNPNADSRERKWTVEHCALGTFKTVAAATENNDEQLGFIVRGILDRLEEI